MQTPAKGPHPHLRSGLVAAILLHGSIVLHCHDIGSKVKSSLRGRHVAKRSI